jgi:hypothetical protein
MWAFYINKYPQNCSSEIANGFSYILIEFEDRLRQAHEIFKDKFGIDPLDLNDCSCGSEHFTWVSGNTIQEATYSERGCKYTGLQFIEEPRDGIESYYTVEQFLYLSDVLVIGAVNLVKSDGMFCSRCKDYFPMAEPNKDGSKWKCFLCRTYPYR